MAFQEVKMATRSRKGYWRMSANSIVQPVLTNRWLHKQGVPDMRKIWIVLHYGPNARCGPACRGGVGCGTRDCLLQSVPGTRLGLNLSPPT